MGTSADSGRRAFVLASGAVITTSVVGRAVAGDSPAKDFIGEYRHKGGEKEQKALEAAIDDVVAGMSILTRGIARGRLRDANPIPAKIQISDDGKSLTVKLDARTYTAPLDGSSVKVKGITGDELALHYEFKGSKLIQVFKGDEKGRVNGFVFDGSDLKLIVRVYASKLPKDLEYSLTYARG